MVSGLYAIKRIYQLGPINTLKRIKHRVQKKRTRFTLKKKRTIKLLSTPGKIFTKNISYIIILKFFLNL